MLVDDHPLLRVGLKAVLTKDPSLQVVAECGDARTALHLLRMEPVDAVILDITLAEGIDGLELIKSILSEHAGMPILVLSVHDENMYALRALAAGARGYQMKDVSPEKLRDSVHDLLRGQITVSPNLAQHMLQRAVFGGNSVKSTVPLSDREMEILLRIGKGQASNQIAASLGITLKTVETHRSNMRRKLFLKSGADLLRYAVAWCHSHEHSSRAAHAMVT
jgi:DNA-binding NarL/FixJ family response regulator